MRHLSAVRVIVSMLLVSTVIATPAMAQSEGALPPRYDLDSNGVNYSTGAIIAQDVGVSIGSAANGMSYARYSSGSIFSRHQYVYALYGDRLLKNPVQAVAGDQTFTFDLVGGVYVNKQGTGETLTVFGTTWTLTLRDGTVVSLDQSVFDDSADTWRYHGAGALAVGKSVIRPNKEKLTLTYKTILTSANSAARLQSVQSSNGYMTKLEYANNTTYGFNWTFVNKATLINSAVEYCNPSADSCTLTGTWPKLTFTGTGATGTHTTTDLLNRVTTYTFATSNLTAVKRPTSAANNTTITYTSTSPQRVSSITTDGRTWNYAWSLAGNLLTGTITNPDSSQRVVISDTTVGLPTSMTDELNRTTTYGYDTNGRLTLVTFPEGNKVQYTYDGRGNITETRQISKTPGTPADIVATAVYAGTCTNPVKCNQPDSVTDPRSKTTTYTYDSTHGGVLTATRPPMPNGVQPQVRYTYSTKQGYYKNSSGSIVASGQSTYLLTGISECQTLATCTGGNADEVKTSIDYGPQTTGTANNLLPISISKGSGDNALTVSVTKTYDNIGNLTYVDGPLPSADADITRTIYDAVRQVVGIIGPRPDGSTGTMANRAVRFSYNLDGQVTKVENGTTAGQSDSSWAAFAPAELVETFYDASGRKTKDTLKNGSTSYALLQYSYDSVGRPECTAVRMNTAIYGSLPSSACTPGSEGADGKDRIRKNVYDIAGEVTEQRTAVGITAEEAAERTLTYTNNGRASTLKDALNNLTTYEYDGFDRLVKTRYPLPTQGSNASSTTDFEQLGYDAASNIVSFRNRSYSSNPTQSEILFTYDNLNRRSSKNLPGSEPDVSYVYDNMGRLITASQVGNSFSFTYDALNRNLTQAGPLGTATSVWDVAARRTQLTYPGGGLVLNYDHLVTGDLTKIRENGAISGVGVLATYGYDSLGHRTSVTFGNNVVQNFTYDPAARLASLSNDLPNDTSKDLTATFTNNPAAGIQSTTRTGDSYAWTEHHNENKSATVNGLNQLASFGAKSLSHDARGNVTDYGTKIFTYSSENLMLTGPNSTTFSYDPLMRLQQVASGATTKLAYDGLDRIAELDGSNGILRRYVHGLGTDEPIVWYEGSGLSSHRFLSSDERGSIISVTDDSGSSVGTNLGINKYDEFGQPQSTNVGKWGYTGQAWIPEIGEWYYKARVYESELGRFLQPDPVGYMESPNLYSYAINDPINRTDPVGLNSDAGVTPQTNVLVIGYYGEALAAASAFAAATMLSDSIHAGWSVTSNGRETVTKGNGGLGDEIIVTARRTAGTVVYTVKYGGRVYVFAGQMAYWSMSTAGRTITFPLGKGKVLKYKAPPKAPAYATQEIDAEGDQVEKMIREQMEKAQSRTEFWLDTLTNLLIIFKQPW